MDYCEAPVSYPVADFYQCYVSGDAVPPTAPGPHPYAYLQDRACVGQCIIRIRLSGYNGAPNNCTEDDFYADNTVVAKPCAGHWPNHNLTPQYWGWWGYFIDDSNTKRIEAGISYAQVLGGDVSQGVQMFGTSYGGTGVLIQSMLVNNVAVVRADVPHTLFVKNFPSQSDLAWQGHDRSAVDFRINANEGVFYRINGSPVDTAVNFDLEIFDVCDSERLACFGSWHDYGHNPCLVGLTPSYCWDLYPGPDSYVRLDKPLVAFSNSSANDEGHHNLGLEWNTGAMTGMRFPLRYRPYPGQPAQVTVDVTVRRSSATAGVVQWQYGEQSGGAAVKDGAVTIKRLTMDAGEQYIALVFEDILGC